MFSDQDLEFNSYEGKVYGIPVSKEISYIYYNKDLFKKAGLEAPDVAYETWDDFYKACDTLKSGIIQGPLGSIATSLLKKCVAIVSYFPPAASDVV